MSIGGIGSTPSFFDQDQAFWSNAKAQSAEQSAANALINVMGAAQVNKAKGLAAIANGAALKRVNSLGVTPGSSTSSSSGTTSSSSSTGSSASTKVQAASGTGTVPVTTTTTLASLGILPGGTISFGDGGGNTTVYTSTGSDSIGDLINAINNGPAFLSASINSSGRLTVTARDTKKSVVVTGSGTDAAAIGFGNTNNTFQPVQPTASSSATSSSSTSASASTSTNSSTASSSSKTGYVPSVSQLNASSAASILSANGVSGTLVDMLS
jgi:hypothetical protein